ncbi:exodeoxyribonuclease III [Bartonella sp. DGB2]|uniref:exodeoxyribonuclease III n=1 Tax=Bartonella sp. DGB2 TaxID=3388426 RepID=UPI00398FD6FE
MKIATWNIAGIKARHETLITWLAQKTPDIVCLQETKTIDEKFPRDAIEDLGYHIEAHGQKSFNGVAVLSKQKPDEVIRGLPGDVEDEQARYIETVYSTTTGVLRVASLYLPNGNPISGPKYAYKLRWMERLYNHAKQRLSYEEPLILAGDYNVIPQEKDAKKPAQWCEDALFVPKTRGAFQKICNLGLYDAIRCVSDESLYSFWDFQAGAWPKNNGIRIDHLLLSPEALNHLKNASIEKSLRGWEKPSDHVPVWIELMLD